MNPSDPNNSPVPAPMPAPEAPVSPTPTAPSFQPQAPAAPVAAPASIAPAGTNPGKGLGIASLVTSILNLGLVGLILGIVALQKSKKAGMSNGLAIAGIVLGILGMLVTALLLLVAFNGVAELATACAESTSGVIQRADGTSYTCPS